MSKNLVEVFNKYTPRGSRRAWMGEAKSLSVRADKERRIVEVTAAFSAVLEKDELYAAENDIRDTYNLNAVKILPKYSSELLSERYITEIFKEAANVRIEVRCFFDGCRYTLTEDKLSITVMYPEQSVQFIENSKTSYSSLSSSSA